MLSRLYQESLALVVDQYELTMAYGYWKDGTSESEAVFNLFFRSHPFGAGFTIAAGLELVCDYLDHFRFSDGDLEYLAEISGNDGKPVFEKAFFQYLRNLEFSCEVDAIPEGTPVFPNEPLLRVQGPLLQCQIIETILLNLINFSTLITTKAARMVRMAGRARVVDFGLRRAQGIDGGLTASRSAYLGGCSATSNVLAGKLLGIPVSGTHAHSWIMFYDDELEAFRKFAAALPGSATFLVDTFDSIQGIRNAIAVGKELREQGHEMVGIRLDSGNLVELSHKARALLDKAGFPSAKIAASNDLDEFVLAEHQQGRAKIDLYGIGTKLVTGGEQAALGGVYKIAACKREGDWKDVIKLSEDAMKINHPGIQQVRRFEKEGHYVADMVYDVRSGPGDNRMVQEADISNSLVFGAEHTHQDLLQPIYRRGKRVCQLPKLLEIRERITRELDKLPEGVLRLKNPVLYPTGLESGLHQVKKHLIEAIRRRTRMQSCVKEGGSCE